MNNKTNVWAVRVGNASTVESVQRIAFSYGYTWLGNTCEKNAVGGYIYFNPTNKKMLAKSGAFNVEADVCRIALTIEDVIDLFTNPPVVKSESETKKTKLPIVEFPYESPTSGRRTRRIMVVETGTGYVSGLDTEDGNLFKCFNKDRIGGTMRFIGMSESKDW
jgi:hypothetical protein